MFWHQSTRGEERNDHVMTYMLGMFYDTKLALGIR